MTLAAGMVLEDSVLLFADTLFSNGETKIYRTKLFRWSAREAYVGFALAGDAFLARMVIDDCRDALDRATAGQMTTTRILKIIRPILRQSYLDHVDSRALSERRGCDFQLLIGIAADGDRPHLYASSATALNRVDRYECAGIGSAIARYVMESGYDPKAPELTFDFEARAITLALQTLVAAKDHVEGVGGASEFLLVERDRVSNAIPFNSKTVEPVARSYQHYATSLLSILADDADDTFVDEMIDAFVEFAKQTRRKWKEATFPPEFRDFVHAMQKRSEENAKITNMKRRQRAKRQVAPAVPKSPKRGRKSRPPSRA